MKEAVIAKVQYDSHSVFEDKLHKMMLKIHDLENELKNEKCLSASWEEKCKKNHALVAKFNIELAHTKDHVNTLNITKKALEDKVASLNVIISYLQKKLHDVEIVSRENVVRYDMIFAQSTNFFAKIKDLEDKFLKRGQTDQTIHMNQPKEFAYYNARKSIGYKSPRYLERTISKSPDNV